ANALFELKGAGFIDFKPGRAGPGANRAPNEYRLTYIPISADIPATNDWAAIETIEEAQAIVREFGRRRRRSKWFNGAATDKSLKSGVKQKKIINLDTKKRVARATIPVGPDQPVPVGTSSTGNTRIPVGPDQPENPVFRLARPQLLSKGYPYIALEGRP